MSHFTVTVCLSAKVVESLGLEDALAQALAPYDENTDTPPYHKYEEGSPEEYWWVRSVRRGAEHLRNGDEPEVRPSVLDREGRVWSNRRSAHITIEQAKADEIEEWKDDAIWAERLGERPTWRDVVENYNAKYHPDDALAIPGQVADDEVDTERLHLDDEGRAYTWSTYNPESKWDWWVIGGRWQRSLISVPGAPANELVFGEAGAFGDNKSPRDTDAGALCCDGGRIELLDFEAMRDRDSAEAVKRYDRWIELVERHGAPEPWERLRSLAEVGEITWDEARKRYNEQSIIKAAREGDEPLIGFFGEPAEVEFGTTREEYDRIARDGAVPGYALLTAEGEWTAPGHMGWFGMSSDGPGERDSFKSAASKYLDALPPSTWVVQVDCHI